MTNLCPHYRKPLYEELARRFELDVFFFETSEPYWNPLLPTFEEGDFRRPELRRVNVLGQPLLPGLADRLTSARYDAVLMDLTGRLMVPYVYAITRARRLPFVLWTGTWRHPGTLFHRVTRRTVEAIYRRADGIIVYGDHVRRALVAVGGVDNSKIFTARQSVNGSKFAVCGDPGRARELIFVGQFEPHKGIYDLLDAFARVADPDARLALVGNGSLEAEVGRRAGADPRIEIVGHVSQDELPKRYARARGLVLPSVTTKAHAETWGLVVNEAMHAGLPVIATDAVGAAAHGLVEDGATGIVVPEGDLEALSTAMANLLSDDELARALGDRALERVSQYTFEAMADAFEAAVEHGIHTRIPIESRAAVA